jgi:hypothetical protein
MLSKFGYGVDQSMSARQKAVKKAVKKYGALSVFRKLNALYILNKNRQPVNAKVFLVDREFVNKQFLS